MAQGIQYLPNFPVNFSDNSDDCNTFDEREYVQKAEQSDRIFIPWEGSQCGSELVTNGSFATLAGWTGTNWSSSNGRAEHTAGSTSPLRQASILTVGRYCKLTFTVHKNNANDDFAGSFVVPGGDSIDSPGEYTIYFGVNSVNLDFTPTTDFNGAIDDVSVFEVNTAYRVGITDCDGNMVKIIYEQVECAINFWTDVKYGVFYINKTWSQFGLSDGCYKFCLIDGCDYDLDCSTITQDEPDTTPPVVQNAYWLGRNSLLVCFGEEMNEATVEDIFNYTITYFNPATQAFEVDFPTTSVYCSSTDSQGGAPRYYVILTTAFTIYNEYNTQISISALEDFAGNVMNPDPVSITIYPYTIDACTGCYDLRADYPCTKLLTWDNDDDAFGLAYSEFESTLVHSLRLDAELRNPKYPEKSNRLRFSNGRNKIIFAQSEKVWELRIDYVPEYIHDAIRLAKIHDRFYIDGVEYYCLEGDYEPEWRGRQRFAQSQIEVQKLIDYNVNNSCS